MDKFGFLCILISNLLNLILQVTKLKYGKESSKVQNALLFGAVLFLVLAAFSILD